MKFLSSLSEMSASEGFPIVLLSGLQAFGALALIIGVLVVMDIIFKKKHPEWENNINENEEETGNNDVDSENGGKDQ